MAHLQPTELEGLFLHTKQKNIVWILNEQQTADSLIINLWEKDEVETPGSFSIPIYINE